MKRFTKKIVIFSIPIFLFLFSGLILPPTPRASKSLLFANLKKDSLLAHTIEPRIIFIGGSNLSFGLNSYMIRDSLCLNPINTAVQSSIGVKYMLENTLEHIKKGDVVVISFEYERFYEPYDNTSNALLRTVADVFPEKKKNLSIKQMINILQYIPKFSLSKFKRPEYFNINESDVYSINSFNKFGDVDAHWNLENRGYSPSTIKGNFHLSVVEKLKQYENSVRQKSGIVYVTFPSLDEITFANSKEKVLLVEQILKENDFKLLGNAERYIMPKEMIFNGTYHVNKKGVDYRTNLFIEDYKVRTHNNVCTK